MMPRVESLQRSRQRLEDGSGQSEFLQSARELGKHNCMRCRRLKVKCFFEHGQDMCKRCVVSRATCDQAQSMPATESTRASASAEQADRDDRIEKMQRTIEELQKTVESINKSREPEALPLMMASPPPSLGTISNLRLSPSDYTGDSIGQDFTTLDGLLCSDDFRRLALNSLFCRAKRAVADGLDYLVLPELLTFEDAYRTRPLLLQVVMTISASASSELHYTFCDQTKKRLLHAYYTENIRNLDLLQALLLAGEYCVPFDKNASWNPQIYMTLANEVAADIHLFADRPFEGADSLEKARTILWLYFVYSLVLGNSARYSIRNVWLPCHDYACKTLQDSLIVKDQRLLTMLHVPRLLVEMRETFSNIETPQIVEDFRQRLIMLRTQTNPCKLASMCLYSCDIHLNEAHLYTHKDNVSLPVIYEHKETMKSCVLGMMEVVESMNGDPMGYPFYVIIKPIYCLIRVVKLFRYFALDESMWLLSFADRVELALMNFANRGSALARSIIGKTTLIMNYWREPSLPDDSPATIMTWALGLHWRPADADVEQIDLLEFATMFDIEASTAAAVKDFYG